MKERTRAKVEIKPSHRHKWMVAGALIVFPALVASYAPALRGPFVFDDFNLPYYNPSFPKDNLLAWIGGVRPLLMFSYWINYCWSGSDPFSYHLLGLLFHMVNGGLVFLIARRLLERSGLSGERGLVGAAFAACLFLLHPVQTESVAYIASRSENLSGLFFLGAYALFLYRGPAGITWPRSFAVMALFAAAVATKEHTAVLIGLIALTDLWWSGKGWRASLEENRRLYFPLLALTAAAGAMVFAVVTASTSAGFRLAGLDHPLTYFWTECRALLTYLELWVFPFRQSIEYDVRWVHAPWSSAATLAGLAALAAMLAVAWFWRSRYPVAAFGLIVFLLLLAPTSSFIPLADPIAEHRMYLPMVGAALVSAEVLIRAFRSRGAMLTAAAAIALIASAATLNRNYVWGSESALWTDALAKAPEKHRDYAHLIHGLIREKHCDAAIAVLEGLERRGKVDWALLIHWSFALECRHDLGGAVDKLQQAVRVAPTPDLYLRVARLETSRRHVEEAKQATNLALALNPNFEAAVALRGDINWWLGDFEAAFRDYTRVLELNPSNAGARRRIQEIARHRASLSATVGGVS